MRLMARFRADYLIRPRTFFFLVVSYLLWASVSLRWIQEFVEQNQPFILLVSAMLGLYGLLLGLEPLLTAGSYLRAHLYLIVQTSLVMAAILFYYQLDFFAILLLPLCGQAIFLFERKSAGAWVVILTLANIAGQIQQFGWPQGLPFILLYSAGLVFVTAFSIMTIQAEQARGRSESLLAELQTAHRQLQAYARQAEELATANERNRLARELHDSVAQTLYGLTLQSEAASRKLVSGQHEVANHFLMQIRQSAQQTLQEIRLLIFELRPPILEAEGLAAALKARLEAVEARSGFKIQTNIPELERLPIDLETGLYRIAQEALNNAMKYSQAGQIKVSMRRADASLILEVMDDGIGFEPVGIAGGMGLKGMNERAEQMQANLSIHSLPGKGTHIKVEVPL
jgi:signal transduction histidine kinase